MPKIYLVDIFQQLTAARRAAVSTILDGFLSKCTVAGQDALVSTWITSDPNPGNLDVLVYVLPREFSAIKAKYGTAVETDVGDQDGMTYPVNNEPTISEVYARNYGDSGTAKLIFHELMHHKLRVGKSMHSRGGLASETVSDKTDLTPQNMVDMTPAFRKPVQQWAGGIKALKDKNAQDPLSPYKTD